MEELYQLGDSPVRVFGSLRPENGEGVDGKGRAFCTQVPACFGGFTAETAEGLIKGDFFFVEGVVPEVGEGRYKLGERGCYVSGLRDNLQAFTDV